MHTAHPLHQQHRRIRQVQTLPGSPATVAERLLSDPPGGRGQGPVPVGYVRFLESNNRVLFTFHSRLSHPITNNSGSDNTKKKGILETNFSLAYTPDSSRHLCPSI